MPTGLTLGGVSLFPCELRAPYFSAICQKSLASVFFLLPLPKASVGPSCRRAVLGSCGRLDHPALPPSPAAILSTGDAFNACEARTFSGGALDPVHSDHLLHHAPRQGVRGHVERLLRLGLRTVRHGG